MKLNIPHLTLAKIAQLGKQKTVNTRSEHFSPRVAGSIPDRGNFFGLIYFALIQFWQNCQNDLFKEKSILLKAYLHVQTTSPLLKAAPLIFLTLCVNSIIELH